MPKKRRYRQTGTALSVPTSRKYGDDAIAKDGTLYTVDESANLVEQAKAVYAVPITIPTASWVASTTHTGYSRQAAITASGILATDNVIINLDAASVVVANTAGVLPGGVTTTNTVTLFAKQNPTAALNGVLRKI